MCKEISQYTSMQLICPHLKLTWLPRWLSGKESGDVGSIPGSERSPGEGNDNPLQYSCLEHPMDRGPWHTAVHGVSKELDTTERLNNNNSPTSPMLTFSLFFQHPAPSHICTLSQAILPKNIFLHLMLLKTMILPPPRSFRFSHAHICLLFRTSLVCLCGNSSLLILCSVFQILSYYPTPYFKTEYPENVLTQIS